MPGPVVLIAINSDNHRHFPGEATDSAPSRACPNIVVVVVDGRPTGHFTAENAVGASN